MHTVINFTNKRCAGPRARRGQKLVAYRYLPERKHAVKAVVHYHHGLGDYAQRNQALFLWLNQHGVAVLTFDCHGHGDSEPHSKDKRVAIKHFDDIVGDACQHFLEVAVPYVSQHYPNAPIFLMGSSMGAAATILMACKDEVKAQPSFRGIVLNAAMVDAHRTWLMRLQEPFAQLANRVMPSVCVIPATPPERYHRDPEELAIRAQDTRLWKRGVRVCTACSMLEAMAMIQQRKGDLTCPILAVHGEADAVCSIEHVARLLREAPSADTKLKTLPDGLHDMLHDYEKDEVRSIMLKWISKRSSGPKIKAGRPHAEAA